MHVHVHTHTTAWACLFPKRCIVHILVKAVAILFLYLVLYDTFFFTLVVINELLITKLIV